MIFWYAYFSFFLGESVPNSLRFFYARLRFVNQLEKQKHQRSRTAVGTCFTWKLTEAISGYEIRKHRERGGGRGATRLDDTVVCTSFFFHPMFFYFKGLKCVIDEENGCKKFDGTSIISSHNHSAIPTSMFKA